MEDPSPQKEGNTWEEYCQKEHRIKLFRIFISQGPFITIVGSGTYAHLLNLLVIYFGGLYLCGTMKHRAYSYRHLEADRFIFTSSGKKNITKAVDFTPTSIKDLFSLSFGDLLPDGSLDDTASSNNGDIVKVLSTVMLITNDYTLQHPHIKLIFSGSTDERTRLYARILKSIMKIFVKTLLSRVFLN